MTNEQRLIAAHLREQARSLAEWEAKEVGAVQAEIDRLTQALRDVRAFHAGRKRDFRQVCARHGHPGWTSSAFHACCTICGAQDYS